MDSLEFLTSRQALADLAHFIKTMTKTWELGKKQKWIVFGGSYAGDLTMWFVEKYPHLVYGGVSASSPVKLQTDFSSKYQNNFFFLYACICNFSY